jgi:hypothetical protein
MQRKPPSFAIGDRVRLTRDFLRNTGQYTGPEGVSRWTVTGIDEYWVITDQRHTDQHIRETWTHDELAADPTLAYRRIHAGNLERVK